MNAKLSHEIDSLMETMQRQINRVVNSAMNDRFLPEILNVRGCLPLDQNSTVTGTSKKGFAISNAWKKTNVKIT